MFIIVGTNHKYSPVAIREKLHFSKGRFAESILKLSGGRAVIGSTIISTCNRVELYATVSDTEEGLASLKGFLAGHCGQSESAVGPYLYIYRGKDAVFHLFSVAAGLDSQIIGELPILKQVESAYNIARTLSCTDIMLDAIFQKAIEIGLRIRKETAISSGDITIGSIVFSLINKRYASLNNKKVLIIGAGKISESVARYLRESGIKTFLVSNRNYGKAEALAKDIGGRAVKFSRLKEELPDSDIVITATASPHIILKKEDMLAAKKPLLIIDLAVPRDVEPEVRGMEGVDLLHLDDLGFIMEERLAGRKTAAPEAVRIIEGAIEELFSVWLYDSAQEPALSH